MTTPTLYEFENNYHKYDNKEELLLLDINSVDVKFILYHKDNINWDKVRELYQRLKENNKLKPNSIEFANMVKRFLNIELE